MANVISNNMLTLLEGEKGDAVEINGVKGTQSPKNTTLIMRIVKSVKR